MIVEFKGAKSIRAEDSLIIAKIMQETFWQKLKWFFKNVSKEESIQLMEKMITYKLGFYYKEDDQVLAAALLSEAGNPHMAVGPEVRSRIGLWRSWLLKVTFTATPRDKDTLCLQMIAVNSNARGKGIGQKMLIHLEEFARNNGYTEIVLDVIDNNSRAKKLYEREGFLVSRHVYTRLFTRGMGFDGIFIMKKKLV